MWLIVKQLKKTGANQIVDRWLILAKAPFAMFTYPFLLRNGNDLHASNILLPSVLTDGEREIKIWL